MILIFTVGLYPAYYFIISGCACRSCWRWTTTWIWSSEIKSTSFNWQDTNVPIKLAPIITNQIAATHTRKHFKLLYICVPTCGLHVQTSVAAGPIAVVLQICSDNLIDIDLCTRFQEQNKVFVCFSVPLTCRIVFTSRYRVTTLQMWHEGLENLEALLVKRIRIISTGGVTGK